MQFQFQIRTGCIFVTSFHKAVGEKFLSAQALETSLSHKQKGRGLWMVVKQSKYKPRPNFILSTQNKLF